MHSIPHLPHQISLSMFESWPFLNCCLLSYCEINRHGTIDCVIGEQIFLLMGSIIFCSSILGWTNFTTLKRQTFDMVDTQVAPDFEKRWPDNNGAIGSSFLPAIVMSNMQGHQADACGCLTAQQSTNTKDAAVHKPHSWEKNSMYKRYSSIF